MCGYPPLVFEQVHWPASCSEACGCQFAGVSQPKPQNVSLNGAHVVSGLCCAAACPRLICCQPPGMSRTLIVVFETLQRLSLQTSTPAFAGHKLGRGHLLPMSITLRWRKIAPPFSIPAIWGLRPLPDFGMLLHQRTLHKKLFVGPLFHKDKLNQSAEPENQLEKLNIWGNHRACKVFLLGFLAFTLELFPSVSKLSLLVEAASKS